jgi:hypothetical protein
MKIKPAGDFRLLGTDEKIQKGKIYKAERATNQPDWIKKEKIFVGNILLEKGEYEIVENNG